MACFPRSVLLRKPLISFMLLRRRYFLSSRRSSHDVAASLLPVVAAPVRPGCRDLLHSALASGHLCQVRAARHCSFLDSVLELLTGNPPCLGTKKQRVVKVATDAWLATAGLRGGQVLEACSCTSPPATLSSPLLPLVPWVQKFLMDWAAKGRKSLLRREWRHEEVCLYLLLLPSMVLLSSLRSRRGATATSTLFSRRGAAALSTPLDVMDWAA